MRREEEMVYNAYFDYCRDKDKALEVINRKNYDIYKGCRDLEDVLINKIKRNGIKQFSIYTVEYYFDFSSYEYDLKKYGNNDVDVKYQFSKLSDNEILDYLDTYRMSKELERDFTYIPYYGDMIEIKS